MPSYLSLHYHLVFSTRDRYPFIQPQWQARLYQLLTATIHTMDGLPQAIGGVADHVHLLVALKAAHSIGDVVQRVKAASTTWMHDEMMLTTFAWQESYAAFTVSASARTRVKSYIANQKIHHRVKTFREELAEMLDKAGVVYDPKYLE